MKMYTFEEGSTLQTVIAKSELKDKAYYRGDCRNAVLGLARWDEKHSCFWYVRHKFGTVVTESIKHPEDDEIFDVFRVKEEVLKPEFDIPLDPHDFIVSAYHAQRSGKSV